MKILYKYTIYFVFINNLVLGQFGHLSKFKISNNATNDHSGLRSNVINCIAIQGDKTTWIGTGQGMAVMRDSVTIFSLDTLRLIDDDPRFLFDSITSLTIQDSIIVFASMTNMDGDPTGTGVYITSNGLTDQIEWHQYDQPIDSENDSLPKFGLGYFLARPLIGTRGVVSYSMDIQNNYLWITSWYGGLRRLDLESTGTWQRIPLPIDNEEKLITCNPADYDNINGKLVLKNYYWDSSDPDGNNNHKTFSVLAYGDTVWVGTANGINRGILGEYGCMDWKHYFHPNDSLSGNWVLDIAKQEIKNQRIIWAVTASALLETELNGLSYSKDDGETWHIVDDLRGVRCHDIDIIDNTVLVASEIGLWKSENGINWNLISPAVEATPVSSNEILSNTVYSVAGDNRAYYNEPLIWIGTPDGLARSYNLKTDNWRIFRAVADHDQVYAYPNPFSPYQHNQLNGDGWVRINTGDKDFQNIKFTVYNFALGKVFSEEFDWQKNPGAIRWNGSDQNGELVANGTYFIHLKLSGINNIENHWIKLVVVK